MSEPKKYRVRILPQNGTTQWLAEEIIVAERFNTSDKGYYVFMEDEKEKYYPINNTIVEEL